MYYRIAIRAANDSCLKWKSTPLASLEALFRLLRLYRAIPQDCLRVFNASSREELNAMLAQENDGLVTNSVPAGQFLRERGMSSAGWRQQDSTERTPAPRTTRTGTLPPSTPLPQSRVQEFLLKEQSGSTLQRRRFELEMGSGGDHDQPYTFTLPFLVPQLLTWTRLMVRVQQGELQP